jgi:hypothetical protein
MKSEEEVASVEKAAEMIAKVIDALVEQARPSAPENYLIAEMLMKLIRQYGERITTFLFVAGGPEVPWLRGSSPVVRFGLVISSIRSEGEICRRYRSSSVNFSPLSLISVARASPRCELCSHTMTFACCPCPVRKPARCSKVSAI